MGRTLSEVRSSFYAAKAARAELDGLEATPDRTSGWEIWSECTIICLWLMEAIFDTHKADVEGYINNSYPNTIPWISDQVAAFQYGDELVCINNRFQYEIIDESKKIIKRRAVNEYGNYVYVKVATESNNLPVPLNQSQLNAFGGQGGYISKIKAPGQRIIIINESADELIIQADAYYDPLVLQADGSLITDASIKPVELKIAADIAIIEFGGELNINKVLDSITSAQGITDGVITSLQARAYSAPNYTPVTHLYIALSGYYTITSLQINYIPNV